MKARWVILLFCFFPSIFLWVHEPDLLKKEDVNRLMLQILSQHLGKQEISGKIIQSALRVYINQFDPHRVYLLESEVAPFDHLSDSKLETLNNEYMRGDFSIFDELNQLIQISIERSRQIRINLEQRDKIALFQSSLLHGKPEEDEETHPSFATDISELREHILGNLESYIITQIQTFGDAATARRREHILKLYEFELRDFENQYLYTNDQGIPLSKAEQDNLFALHLLKALASSLDAHTNFYASNEAYDMKVRLQKEFRGFGLGLKEVPVGTIVASLIPGGSADKSEKIKINDQLIEINGIDVTDYPFRMIMKILHTDPQPEIHLVFIRTEENQHQQRIQVTLKRQEIVLSSNRVDVSYDPYGNGIIGKITLHSFYQGEGVSSEQDVRESIERLKKQGNLRGLILDLRENSGGFLSQAVKVAGLFITNGVIVISKYANGEEHFYRDVDGKVVYSGPLVILTSKATASAAEIVAQALQDYGVALVVGDEHTYGKGTIQTQTVTDNQSTSYFKVTVGKYYTVSGHTPQKNGVHADILVPSRWSREAIGEMYQPSEGADTIDAMYEDDLSDVSPNTKAWYLKYYIPTIQHQVNTWRHFIPLLTKNSEYRISNNKNYQFFLKGKAANDQAEDKDEMENDKSIESTYGIEDLQMQEAVNVVKDMIILHSFEPKISH